MASFIWWMDLWYNSIYYFELQNNLTLLFFNLDVRLGEKPLFLKATMKIRSNLPLVFFINWGRFGCGCGCLADNSPAWMNGIHFGYLLVTVIHRRLLVLFFIFWNCIGPMNSHKLSFSFDITINRFFVLDSRKLFFAQITSSFHIDLKFITFINFKSKHHIF